MMVMNTQSQSIFSTNNRKLLGIISVVFWVGALTLVACGLGAFIAVIYLINLTLDAVTELTAHLASLYTSTDSLGRILLWIVALYVTAKLAPWVARALRKAYQSLYQAIGW